MMVLLRLMMVIILILLTKSKLSQYLSCIIVLDLYREMYYGSPNKGDSQTYQGDLNLGWRYEGFMGHSGIPFIVVDIYKD